MIWGSWSTRHLLRKLATNYDHSNQPRLFKFECARVGSHFLATADKLPLFTCVFVRVTPGCCCVKLQLATVLCLSPIFHPQSTPRQHLLQWPVWGASKGKAINDLWSNSIEKNSTLEFQCLDTRRKCVSLQCRHVYSLTLNEFFRFLS